MAAPGAPDTLLTSPSKSFVVAFPKIFGPTIVKAALPIAKRITIKIDNL